MAAVLRYASLLEPAGGPVATTIRTKHGLRIAAAAAVLTSTAALQPTTAQEPAGPVSVDVSECVKLTTPEERLACFEAQVDATRTAPAAAGPAAASSAAPDDFGLPQRDDEKREGEAPPLEIIAKVAELRETVPNAFLITLDNGQVWRQTQPRYNYSLRPGYDVRIWTSRIRSFRLESRQLPGYIQVERVR